MIIYRLLKAYNDSDIICQTGWCVILFEAFDILMPHRVKSRANHRLDNNYRVG